MDVPNEIIELVEKFERNIDAYKSSSFKEEQLKQEFINPFLKALGWDVDNTALTNVQGIKSSILSVLSSMQNLRDSFYNIPHYPEILILLKNIQLH